MFWIVCGWLCHVLKAERSMRVCRSSRMDARPWPYDILVAGTFHGEHGAQLMLVYQLTAGRGHMVTHSKPEYETRSCILYTLSLTWADLPRLSYSNRVLTWRTHAPTGRWGDTQASIYVAGRSRRTSPLRCQLGVQNHCRVPDHTAWVDDAWVTAVRLYTVNQSAVRM